MAKQRRNFTREFKVEAVRRVAAGGKSLAKVARELDLGESLLRSWKATLAAEGEQAFPSKSISRPSRRNSIGCGPRTRSSAWSATSYL